jgi:hypothetical protein
MTMITANARSIVLAISDDMFRLLRDLRLSADGQALSSRLISASRKLPQSV